MLKVAWKVLLVLCVVGLVLVACGQGNEDEARGSQNTEQEEVAENGSDETQTEATEEEEEPLGEDDLAPAEEQESTTENVTLYFADNQLMGNYRFSQDIVVQGDQDVMEVAFQAWIAGPPHTELSTLIPAEVVLEYIQIKDGIAHVSFSEEIRNANLGSSGENMLVTQIVMIMKEFGYDQTQILIGGEVHESLAGHLLIDEPLTAPDPEEFEWME